jgi:hypothetical protein
MSWWQSSGSFPGDPHGCLTVRSGAVRLSNQYRGVSSGLMRTAHDTAEKRPYITEGNPHSYQVIWLATVLLLGRIVCSRRLVPT